MALLLSIAAVSLSACTGERPVLTPQEGPARPAPTDPAVIAVADLLVSSPVRFSATYEIVPTAAGSESISASVARDGASQHVMVGEVDIFVAADGAISCQQGQTSCQTGIKDNFISNLNVTHEFWGPASQRRLLTDDARKIGTPTGYTDSVGGTDATCVDIPVAGPTASGSVTYCATDTGILARYSGADTTIELKSTSDTVADDAFDAPVTG